MILVGTDTLTETLEYVSNLLNHPEILKKVRTKTDNQIVLDLLID